MNTPDFNLRHRDLFTETEKNVLKEFSTTIERHALTVKTVIGVSLPIFVDR